MAHYELRPTAAHRLPLFQRLSELFDTPFDRRSREIARRVAQLRTCSDAQLARMGLPRDQIVLHVMVCAVRGLPVAENDRS